jgi:transcription antitermination factor NusG
MEPLEGPEEENRLAAVSGLLLRAVQRARASSEGEPAPIPEHEIDSIRTLIDSELAYDPCPMIREGMMVEVVHGPLKGVVGRLLRKGAHARLMLSVDLIGQAVSVEVDAADVRAY